MEGLAVRGLFYASEKRDNRVKSPTFVYNFRPTSHIELENHDNTKMPFGKM